MRRANHRNMLGCLLSLAACACTAATDGGREPGSASGGAAVAILAASRAAATDGGQGGPPASDAAEPLAPTTAGRSGLEPADGTVGPADIDRARFPGPARPARPHRLLYRRLP